MQASRIRLGLLTYLLPLSQTTVQESVQTRQGTDASAAGKTWDALVADYVKIKLESKPKDRPAKAFVPRFMKLAKLHESTETEAKALLWVILNGRDREATPIAAKGLVDRHLDSQQTWAMLQNWFRIMRLPRPELDAMLQTVITKSRNQRSVTEAHWARTRIFMGSKKAKASATILRNDYPDSTPALRFKGVAYKKKHLQIGMTAPDIEGEDIDGVAFKLSDYRGKVVLLDFWGDW